MARSLATNEDERRTLHTLAHNLSYEVMPFKTAVEKVRAHVPTEVPLTVTATGAKASSPRWTSPRSWPEAAIPWHPTCRRGWSPDPTSSTPSSSGSRRPESIASSSSAATLRSLRGVPRGSRPAPSARRERSPLRRHRHRRLPEGHAFFDDAVIGEALRRKAAHSHRILTQICFDPDAYIKWGTQLRQEGVDLPVYAGVPGPVSRQKLMRISASLGLGPSANFLKKQQNMLWKFFTLRIPADGASAGLVQKLHTADTRIAGLHIYTFNDLERTEAWRQELLAQARG
ncbi:methylenetetrahydrofolate reductase [Nesterenkonia pannonica]|uniref:methylenetetrahydrofolate reductase n=1 Tax=Nesterenkonia pannonica TaxID=1548602 RepID=UPI00216489B7|nr:methylenetetrahydrofolate reductase [Nesterenkonia pannonica]